jgi:DNA-directed RNA polymerase subunit RPC12/RpoP
MGYATCMDCGHRSVYHSRLFPVTIYTKGGNKKYICASCVIERQRITEASNIVRALRPGIKGRNLRKQMDRLNVYEPSYTPKVI